MVSGTTDVVDEVDGVVATVVGVGARSRRGRVGQPDGCDPDGDGYDERGGRNARDPSGPPRRRTSHTPAVGRPDTSGLRSFDAAGAADQVGRVRVDSETSTTSPARPPRTARVRQSPSSASTIVRRRPASVGRATTSSPRRCDRVARRLRRRSARRPPAATAPSAPASGSAASNTRRPVRRQRCPLSVSRHPRDGAIAERALVRVETPVLLALLDPHVVDESVPRRCHDPTSLDLHDAARRAPAGPAPGRHPARCPR